MPHENWAVRLKEGPAGELLETGMTYASADSAARSLSKSNRGKSYAVADSRRPKFTYAVYRNGKDVS